MIFNAPQVTLQDLVDYCLNFGSEHNFSNWSRPVLSQYLAFHVRQETVGYTCRDGRIVGVGVAWQFNAREAEHPDFIRSPFHWQPTNPAGDSLFIADLICTDSMAMSILSARILGRWPRWADLQCFAIRREKLVTYNLRRLLQLAIL